MSVLSESKKQYEQFVRGQRKLFMTTECLCQAVKFRANIGAFNRPVRNDVNEVSELNKRYLI